MNQSPTNKKAYIAEIGKILLETCGKRKFYTPEEVLLAYESSSFKADSHVSWAMCIYTSHNSFNQFYNNNEGYDYNKMRSEMLSEVSNIPYLDIAELLTTDVDLSWLDFEDMFDGIGDFIAGILDGLS